MLVLPLGDGVGDSVTVTTVSDVRYGVQPVSTASMVIRDPLSADVHSVDVAGEVRTLDSACDISIEYCSYQVTWSMNWDGRNQASDPVPAGDYTVVTDGAYSASIQVRDLALLAVSGPAVTYLAPYVDGVLDEATFTSVGTTYGDAAIATTGTATLTRNADGANAGSWEWTVPALSHDVPITGLALGAYTMHVTLIFDGVEQSRDFDVESVQNAALATSVGVSARKIFPAVDGYLDKLQVSVSTTMAPHVVLPVAGYVRIKRGSVKIVDLPLSSSQQTVTWNGRVGGHIIPGTYTAIAYVRGQEGGWVSRTASSVVVSLTYATRVVVRAAPASVFPVVDGYRDKTVLTAGALQSTGRYGTAGSLAVVVTKGRIAVARWTYRGTTLRNITWNGRLKGRVVPGVYVLTVTARGPEGLAKVGAKAIVVSAKHLVRHIATQTKAYTAAAALDQCGGFGYFACENLSSWSIGGRSYSPTMRYYTGFDPSTDLLWASHSLPLPVGTTKYRIQIIADTYDASYVLGLCYTNAADVNDCPTGKRFPTYSEGTFDMGWSSVGVADRWADFYIGANEWGSLYVARYVITAQYSYKVLQ